MALLIGSGNAILFFFLIALILHNFFFFFIFCCRAAVFVREVDVLTIVPTLRKISAKRIAEMQKNCIWLWERYFQTMEKITEMTLEVIEDRVFPHLARDYGHWNLPAREVGSLLSKIN